MISPKSYALTEMKPNMEDDLTEKCVFMAIWLRQILEKMSKMILLIKHVHIIFCSQSE